MKSLDISNYTGYRHNRYDRYQTSWGVLSALGAIHYSGLLC